MSTTTPWEQVEAEFLAAMSDKERAEYDAGLIEAEARLQLAELVYDARTTAGLSQTELAARAGTRQGVISAIENGAQVPSGIMLARIANALGKHVGLVDVTAPQDRMTPDRADVTDDAESYVETRIDETKTELQGGTSW